MRTSFENINIFQRPDLLHTQIGQFLRWQQEIAGLRTGLMPSVINNEELAEDALVPGTEKIETKKQKARRLLRELIARLTQEQIAKMMAMMLAILTKTETFLDVLENALDKKIKQVEKKSPEAAQELKILKKEVQQAKTEIHAQKENLENREEPPSVEELDEINETVEQKTSWATRLAQSFHAKLKNMMGKKEQVVTTLAAEELHRSAQNESAPGHNINAPFPESDDEEIEEEEPEEAPALNGQN